MKDFLSAAAREPGSIDICIASLIVSRLGRFEKSGLI
jgi:hypothetical protein